jgi:hypothetical protein
MATSASQPYIAKLGFQDRDRSSDRHGLACEYLFERLLELEVTPFTYDCQCAELQREIHYRSQSIKQGYSFFGDALDELTQQLPGLTAELQQLTVDSVLAELRGSCKVGECLNVPITSRSYVNGFADILITKKNTAGRDVAGWLGEVKITKEPAENVLQQINFYLSYLPHVHSVYLLTDYDPSDLQRLCAGTKIKVFRLGQRFEQWLSNRPSHATDEL